MAFLYIIATPIGNLEDITLRAIRTLKEVDAVFCEDTRVTAKLLAHFDIKKPLFAYHQHSGPEVIAQIGSTLREGMSVALVSDAGTPGINDPGGLLVQQLLRSVPDLQVIPLPGPNAALTALSASGLPADQYTYLGFVPQKKGRQTFFLDLAAMESTVVFYESKHRIVKTLEQLQQALEEAGTPLRPVVLARELTKRFETFYRGSAAQALEALKAGEVLGEFVVIVGPRNWKTA